jgi:hypothetical protein
MVFSIALDVLIGVYILSRQRRIRVVPRALSLRFPIVVGVIGLIDLLSYTDTHHHITSTDWAWVVGTIAVGAVLLGAIRAFTVKIWTSNSWVVRQGTWLTIGLWVLSLALHFAGGIGAQHSGAGRLEASSFLLYLAITYGVQNTIVHRRAAPLWDALGPEAGHRLQVSFGQGPGGVGTFFTMFGGGNGGVPGFGPGNGPGFGPGFGPGHGPGFGPGGQSNPSSQNDPTIIDAEVVEDDDGPPELQRGG